MEELYVVIYTDYENGEQIVCQNSAKQTLFHTVEDAKECIDFIVHHGYDEFNYRIAKLSFLD